MIFFITGNEIGNMTVFSQFVQTGSCQFEKNTKNPWKIRKWEGGGVNSLLSLYWLLIIIIKYTTIYWSQIDCEHHQYTNMQWNINNLLISHWLLIYHSIHEYAMHKQFRELTLPVNIIQYTNMQWINTLFNSVWPLFLYSCMYRYNCFAFYYTFVLGT